MATLLRHALLRSLLPLIIWFGVAQPLFAIDCSQLEADARRDNLKRTHDNFDTTTELAEFWEIHPRFGFVRDGERILLVARDQQIVDLVLADFKSLGVTAELPGVAFDKVPDGIAVDVTTALPAVLVRLHGRGLKSDGANCWHHCLLDLVTKGTLPMSAAEFMHWMNSPLAKEIAGQDQLRAGDVLVFRKTDAPANMPAKNEVHGAMFLTDNLVIAKSAMGRHYPLRLLDRREAVGFYFPGRSEKIQAFRLQNIIEAANSLSGPRGQEIQGLIKKALELEAQSEALFYGRMPNGNRISTTERFELIDRLERFGEQLQLKANAAIQSLSKLENSADVAMELALWQGLKFKANTYIQLDMIIDYRTRQKLRPSGNHLESIKSSVILSTAHRKSTPFSSLVIPVNLPKRSTNLNCFAAVAG